MKKCDNCGEDILDEANHCPFCGLELKKESVESFKDVEKEHIKSENSNCNIEEKNFCPNCGKMLKTEQNFALFVGNKFKKPLTQ